MMMISLFILAALSGALLGWLMGFLSLFLILLVLVQRGKGGGLTGALGGPGGQSAFGSKAGDTFTVITVIVASIWGFTCAFTMWLLGTHAPSVTFKDSNIAAGPRDTPPEDSSNILIPSPDGVVPGGDPTFGAPETPAMDLVPADREATENREVSEDSEVSEDVDPAESAETGQPETQP